MRNCFFKDTDSPFSHILSHIPASCILNRKKNQLDILLLSIHTAGYEMINPLKSLISYPVCAAVMSPFLNQALKL